MFKLVSIKVKNKLEFVHCWPEAPANVNYLKYPHRHMLHIVSTIEVTHEDRELEFITVQHEIDNFLSSCTFNVSTSCEMVADRIAQFILAKYGQRFVSVSVSEDDENGAIVIYEKEED